MSEALPNLVAQIAEAEGYRHGNIASLFADAQFAGMDRGLLGGAVREALHHNHQHCAHRDPISADDVMRVFQRGSHPNAPQPDMIIAEIVPSHASRTVKPVRTIHTIKKERSSQLTSDFLSHTNKFLGATSLVCAALSSVEACKNIRQATQPDAQGERTVQWSHVGMAVINTALTAGLAYVGVQQLRGRAIF